MTYQNAAAIAEQIGEYSPQVGDEFIYKSSYPIIVTKIMGDSLSNGRWIVKIKDCTLTRTASGITINEVPND